MSKLKNEPMVLLDIHLKNPIGRAEIIGLKSQLINARSHDYLIINAGAYDFVSLEIHEQFRHMLSDLEPCLMKFKKIAVIHSPVSIKESSSPHRYNLCISREKAIEWLAS